MVYINNGEHDNSHELPNENLEGSLDTIYTDYTHTNIPPKLPEEIEKLEYIYQHFQDHEKIYETDPWVTIEQTDDTLYPQINNDIEYGLFENVIECYYLDNQIRDDFTYTKVCYTHDTTASTLDTNTQCTHTYDISQQLDSLANAEQQQMLYTNKADTSLFTTDTSIQCAFNITPSNLETESEKDMNDTPQNNTGIHFYSKHKYRDTFGDAHIQYHDFDNDDAFVYRDKYTSLLQQELQNPYWCSHDPVTTKNYQISTDMDTETMPQTIYFSGNTHTVTKINHVPYQTIQYNDKGMFPAQLMDDTPIQVFINNGATPSILPLSTYNKYPMLQKYPKTKSTTPIYTGGGTIKSHLWIELPLKLENQTIQIKVLVCDSECPYNILIGRTLLAHLSTWQDYAMNKLYTQQISIPIVAKNNVRILPGCTGIVSAGLKTSKSTFIPRNTIMGKGVAYVRPFDKMLPLRPIEIGFKNNKCCIEIHNSSDSTVEFLFDNEIAYFDARSKGLVQANNSKHFPIDQYLHDRVTPATLSPKPLAYNKPVDPSEMPRISMCTNTITENTNVPTKDDKYPWLFPDDK